MIIFPDILTDEVFVDALVSLTVIVLLKNFISFSSILEIYKPGESFLLFI